MIGIYGVNGKGIGRGKDPETVGLRAQFCLLLSCRRGWPVLAIPRSKELSIIMTF